MNIQNRPNLAQALSVAGRTENGAESFNTTSSKVLDFYVHGGALRSRKQYDRAVELFAPAYVEDPVLAILALFYLRDVRGGQGEREVFLRCLEWLATNHPAMYRKLLPLIPEYGRWSDVVLFIGHPNVNSDIVWFVQQQLRRDIAAEHPSLLAKWLPSRNASSYATKALADAWIQALGYGTDANILHITGRNVHKELHNRAQRKYRKLLVGLRAKIGIVESLMSSGQWEKINFSHVPAAAMKLYRNAYKKRQGERFAEWLAGLRKGVGKINIGGTTPYDLLKAYMPNGDFGGYSRQSTTEQDDLVEAMWENLPDYVGDQDVLVVADFSGSMDGEPMVMSAAMALYTAKHNKGQFRGKFISFSHKPDFVDVSGAASLFDAIQIVKQSNMGANTDLQAVFDLILGWAVRQHVPQEQMPKRVMIVSDMQFDEATGASGSRWSFMQLAPITNHEALVQKYADAGYTVPELVYWNVRSANTDSPVDKNQQGVYLVSGSHPVIIEKALHADMSKTEIPAPPTPYESMLDVLNNERYAPVRVAME